MNNILSIDVESWVHFHHDALKSTNNLTSEDRKKLDGGYVREAIFRLLDILDQRQHHATFFVVAEIYDWYPEAIDAIVTRGHEIGYHTFKHTVLSSADLLRTELSQSERFIARYHPKGFRAPQIVLTRDAFPLLKEYGFSYSSSTYDHRGKTVIDGVDEIPVSTVLWRGKYVPYAPHEEVVLPRKLTLGLLSQAWPVGSGLSLVIGGRLTARCMRIVNERYQQPVMLFVHPWQLFDHPMIRGPKFLAQVVQRNPLCVPYVKNVMPALSYLMNQFHFVSCNEFYYG